VPKRSAHRKRSAVKPIKIKQLFERNKMLQSVHIGKRGAMPSPPQKLRSEPKRGLRSVVDRREQHLPHLPLSRPDRGRSVSRAHKSALFVLLRELNVERRSSALVK